VGKCARSFVYIEISFLPQAFEVGDAVRDFHRITPTFGVFCL
jgi:hypothetical protein